MSTFGNACAAARQAIANWFHENPGWKDVLTVDEDKVEGGCLSITYSTVTMISVNPNTGFSSPFRGYVHYDVNAQRMKDFFIIEFDRDPSHGSMEQQQRGLRAMIDRRFPALEIDVKDEYHDGKKIEITVDVDWIGIEAARPERLRFQCDLLLGIFKDAFTSLLLSIENDDVSLAR